MKHVIKELGIKTEAPEIPADVTNAHPTYEHLMPRYRDCRLFAAIRHPVTWLESHFRYQTQHEWRKWEKPKWHPLRIIEDCQSRDFGDFIDRYLAWHAGFVSQMFEQYIGIGRFCAACIMGQETLDFDLRLTLTQLGCLDWRDKAFDIAPVNTTDKRGIEMPWRPGQKESVLESEKNIIDCFYSKETQLAV